MNSINIELKINNKDYVLLPREEYINLTTCEAESERPGVQEELKEASVNSIEIQIAALLLKIGVPRHIKGYRFIREAVVECVRNTDMVDKITKSLYPHIAGRNNTTPSRVERAIRHAIEVAWSRGHLETINSLFGYVEVKPTNSEFIATIADVLRLKN